MVTQTSIQAYREITDDGLLNRCEKLVLDYIISHPDCYEREISEAIKLPINNVCGRTNQLLKYRVVSKSGKTISKFSDKVVETYTYNEGLPIEELRMNVKRVRGIKGKQKKLMGFI
jgi:hypothetical protein